MIKNLIKNLVLSYRLLLFRLTGNGKNKGATVKILRMDELATMLVERARVLLDTARVLLDTGKVNESLTVCDSAIAVLKVYTTLPVADSKSRSGILIAAQFLETQNLRAQILRNADRTNEALAACDAAFDVYATLPVRPWSVLAHLLVSRAMVLLVAGQGNEALTDCEKALEEYEALPAANKKLWRNVLADVLAVRAEALLDTGRVDEALADYEKAIEVYTTLPEANRKHWEVIQGAVIVRRARTLLDTGRVDEALAECKKTFNEYTILSETDKKNQWGYWANVVAIRAEILLDAGQLDDALVDFDKAISAYAVLLEEGKEIWRGKWATTLVKWIRSIQNSGRRNKAVEMAIKGLNDLARCDSVSFVSDNELLIFLNELSQICLDIFGIASGVQGVSIDDLEKAYRHSVVTLSRHFEFAHAANLSDLNSFHDQEANLNRFWSLWLEQFIQLGRYDLVLDVVSRSHSRRTATQALTALYRQRESESLTTDQTRYLELVSALHQIELELMRESKTGFGGMDDLFGLRSFFALPHDGAFQLRRAEIFEAKREQHATLAREARQLKQRLIKAGDLPDVATIDRALRQLLESNAVADRIQAVALWVVPQEYGIERPPFLLLVHPTGITPLLRAAPSPVPDLAQAMDLEKNLRKRIATGRCVRDWDSAGTTDDLTPSGDADNPRNAIELDRQLREFMACQLWQPLVERCQALGVTTLHLVTAGELHALPWQGSAPPALQVRLHPSLYGYVKATHPRQEAHQRPSPERPLAVVAHDAHADGPGRRLYCAHLEVECLRAVWGDDAVIVGVENLDGRKPCAVTLIGHGGFDAQSGRAGLYLGQDEEGRVRLFDQTALASLPAAYQGLQASACVLGRVVDVEKEPAGLMAAAMAVPSVQSCAGALLPVDDGLATLLSLLFHCHWKAGSRPREAFQAAQASLREGCWPPEATAALQQAAEWTLPEMVCALDDDLGQAKRVADDHRQRQAAVKRIEGAIALLTLNGDPDIRRAWNAVHKAMKRHDDPVHARAMAREWARLFAQKAPSRIADYEDLAVFVHYWLVS